MRVDQKMSHEISRAISELIDQNTKFRDELHSQLGWLRHWQDDHRAGLLPTEQSLNDAREAIEKVLGK